MRTRLLGCIAGGDFSITAVTGFAMQMGIHPGIVVGRLHHEELLTHDEPAA